MGKEVKDMPPTISIFTPTYNRKDTLVRLYESIKVQNFKDFEWIIVDDGSIDNTSELVAFWIRESNFTIKYFYQENSGKHVARNFALEKANGVFFLTIDSDDFFLDDALELMIQAWERYKDEDPKLIGVEGHAININTNTITGSLYKENFLISNHIKTRAQDKVTGDKLRMLKTEVFKKYTFPVYFNEKFVPEGIVWNQLSLEYNILYINNPIAVLDYQVNGITASSVKHRAKNSVGAAMYYVKYIEVSKKVIGSKNKKNILKAKFNTARFYYHSNAQEKTFIEEEIHGWKLNIFYRFLGIILSNKDKKEMLI